MHQDLNSFFRLFSDRRIILVVVAALTISVVAACGDGDRPSAGDQSIPRIIPTVSERNCVNAIQPSDAPQFADIDSTRFEPLMDGIRYYEIKAGTGEMPTLADAVSVEYAGWLETGCMFDTSYANEGPTTFPLINVIPGWQRSMSSMKEGSAWVIEVDSELAYRATGLLPRIPPDATLFFYVELFERITFAEADATVQAERAIATAEAEEASATAQAEADDATATAEAEAESATATAEAEAITPTPEDQALDATAVAVESESVESVPE